MSDMKLLNYLQAGINAESTRQSVIANNMANMNTKGYRKFDIKFEEAFAKLIDSSEDFNPSDIEAELFQPKNTPINAQGNDVNIHAEVGELVKNTIRHKAFVRILAKKYQQYELAMRVP
ncbi:MAG: flagellar basal body rod protein FlgB [Planctomycetes bacterium]|nr:flagellar basal body rod protein FlgB [Planctomycetota bacterium]